MSITIKGKDIEVGDVIEVDGHIVEILDARDISPEVIVVMVAIGGDLLVHEIGTDDVIEVL
jgi:hypothetical protein